MASGDILNQINANKEKINQLNRIQAKLESKKASVKKSERTYQYISNEWCGDKEVEISKDLGLYDSGMNAIRNQIAADAEAAINSIEQEKNALSRSNRMLHTSYVVTKAAEKAAQEAERKRNEKNNQV